MLDALLPPAIFGQQTQEQAPIVQDAIFECAQAYEARMALTNDPRQGTLALLDRLRDELDGAPVVGPAKQGARISRRRQKQLRRALDRIIEQGRSAA